MWFNPVARINDVFHVGLSATITLPGKQDMSAGELLRYIYEQDGNITFYLVSRTAFFPDRRDPLVMRRQERGQTSVVNNVVRAMLRYVIVRNRDCPYLVCRAPSNHPNDCKEAGVVILLSLSHVL